MKLDDLRNASASVRALNAALFETGGVSQGSKPQQAVRHESLGKTQGTCLYTTRCLVSVTSYRCGTPVDPDGLCAKWMVDALRYCGILRDDRAEDIDYQVRQVRVKTHREERTEVEVIPLPNAGDVPRAGNGPEPKEKNTL